MERKAVTWLAEKLGKPISKLEEDDYLQNSLTVSPPIDPIL